MSEKAKSVSVINDRDYAYDIEVWPNIFTITIRHIRSDKSRQFEISFRKNELPDILATVSRLQKLNARMVGFNNIGYDYPVFHHLLTRLSDYTDPLYICERLYKKSKEIINTHENFRFQNQVWESDWLVSQMDLFKIHHYDNKARMTSLKMLQFNMRMTNIQETPVAFDIVVDSNQADLILQYNDHDVIATKGFYVLSMTEIAFREQLSEKYGKNFINHSDAKIGSDYFIMQLEKRLGKDACYVTEKVNGKNKRKPRQTPRESISLQEVIFDYVRFERPEYKAVTGWIEKQNIKETKAVFTEIPEDSLGELIPYCNLKKKKGNVKNLNCIVDGLQFNFGTGGIHASVHNTKIFSDEIYIIVDIDVKGYYPSLGIANEVYPEHLTKKFCAISSDLIAERDMHDKGTIENKALKLSGNAAYGNSNSKFSMFYDPKYTMTITVNGQLLLCMLYEQLRKIKNSKLIQMNTDGLTIRIPRTEMDQLDRMKSSWELMTGLTLDKVIYKSMHIRDVNNYIAIDMDGKAKNKGAYEFEYAKSSLWHKNFSSLVVKKAADAFIVKGTDIEEFILNHQDDYDFLLRTKVPKSSRLVGDNGMEDHELQNITRYYISTEGFELVKIMPPLPKKPGIYRRISVNKGCKVTVMNKLEPLDRDTVDFQWYIEQATKLVNFEGDFENGSEEDSDE